MGNRRWGSGMTLADAKRQWCALGGRLSDGYTVYTFDSESVFHGVTIDGRITYSGNDPAETVVKPRRK